MATKYYKTADTYFKIDDSTNSIISVTTNSTNKCIAMSIDNSGSPSTPIIEFDSYVERGEAESISSSLFEEKKIEVKQYISDNL
tara:strand:- start:939 stop:1190 length:252 start_codon:yes stop_codon:yes gene_type:complete